MLEKRDIKSATTIVGQNYSKEYEALSILEIKDMFGKSSNTPVYYVAEDKEVIIGFAGYIQSLMDYNVYQIFWVNVTPDQQGKGIGKQLVARIIKEIKKNKNANIIQLTTSSPSFYKKHFGFKSFAKFHNKSHDLMMLSLER